MKPWNTYSLCCTRGDNSIKPSDTEKGASKVHKPINERQWKQRWISLPDVRGDWQPVSGSLPAAPHPVLSTRGSWAKRKDAVNNSGPSWTPHNTATKDKIKLLAKQAPQKADSASQHSLLYIDHMDIIITRGMNQQILDLEPKITRHLN